MTIRNCGSNHLVFWGAIIGIFIASCSSMNIGSSCAIIKLSISSGNYSTKFVLFRNSIFYSVRNDSSGREVMHERRDLSDEEVGDIIGKLLLLKVDKWNKDYGDHLDPSNRELLVAEEEIPVTSWRVHLDFDGKTNNSKGNGMFPSSGNYLNPSGPVRTSIFVRLLNILSASFE